MSDDVEGAIRRCVATHTGHQVAGLETVAAELSLHDFWRVQLVGGGSLIARRARPEDPAGRPAGVPPEPPLEPVLALFADAGLPVAAVRGRDPEADLLLLEDLGARSLEDAARECDPATRRALYAATAALIPRIQAIAPPPEGHPSFARRLDDALFRYKAELFARHSLPAALGREPRPSERALVTEAFGHIAQRCAEAPARLAHRDLQSRNVLVGGDGAPRLLDVQGAFLAPPEYDAVCLLRDSYVELPEDERGDHAEAVRAALPEAPAPEAFAARFDLLTLTRKGKDHARFLYAARERGDDRYADALPATTRALHAAAARAARREPILADFAELVRRLPETPCVR